MRVPVVLACVFALAGCSGGGSNSSGTPTGPNNPPPTGNNKTVQATSSLTFTPSSVSIAVGDSVTWEFGSVAHTVTFQQGAADPGDYGGGGSTGTPPANIPSSSNVSIGRRFLTAGTYQYRCSIHPGMTGTVTVN